MPAPITGHSFAPQMPSLPAMKPQRDPPAGPAFADLLGQAVGRGAAMQAEADRAVMHALAGGDISQVEVLSAVKKADLALRMMLQVRNKLLDAYNEIQQIRF